MAKRPRVEMRPAYEWTCDECGKDNFERAVVAELSQEEMAELRNDHGIQVWEQGNFQTIPDHVECKHCGAEFDTDHWSEATDG